jgi:D-inositol-3-phosphate glycosyltransferase
VTDDRLRARLETGAVEHARDFSWEKTTDRTLEIYRQARSLMRAEVT